jgi:hypothetical protein
LRRALVRLLMMVIVIEFMRIAKFSAPVTGLAGVVRAMRRPAGIRAGDAVTRAGLFGVRSIRDLTPTASCQGRRSLTRVVATLFLSNQAAGLIAKQAAWLPRQVAL